MIAKVDTSIRVRAACFIFCDKTDRESGSGVKAKKTRRGNDWRIAQEEMT